MLKVLEKLPKIIGHIYTMLLVLISWVIFAFEDLGQVGTYLSTMFNLNGVSLANPEAIYYLRNYIIIIIIGVICSIPVLSMVKKFKKNEERKQEVINQEKLEKEEGIKDNQNTNNLNQKKENMKKANVFAILTSVAYVVIFILCTASLVNNSFNPFLYFRF